jgi:hypothetical protein
MTTKQDNTDWKHSSKEGMNKQVEPQDNPGPNKEEPVGSDNPASRYLRENFAPDDRIAVVAINKRSGAVIQRLARAESIAAPDTQKWLRYMNDHRYEIYISMNALKEDAQGRTKEDIGQIRHIYLDLDHGGEEALKKVLGHTNLPKPSYVLTTSPERYQVVWKVKGFERDQAEQLQQKLAREMEADPAATDSSRVLRLPGFKNNKYGEPSVVEAKTHSDKTHNPEDFNKWRGIDQSADHNMSQSTSSSPHMSRKPERITQSEKDWAYAKRALARGESKESVIAAMSKYRQFDKLRPQYYAEHTVEKASRTLTTKSQSNEHMRDGNRER